ncbi:type II toxin-antitoxin system VapC family toxin [Saccharopolyspora sp. 5N708]|uniref:type II toxin-antitoxin system VapC family toxin n=1 Tax=Saccharopolyspora sp. 5N708 TaxID=3457424 RepID=UPI003FD33FB5
MLACDVNIFVSAYNRQDPLQPEFGAWLEKALNGPEPVGVASVVLSGFIRIMTSNRVLREPLLPSAAVDIADHIMNSDRAVKLDPGPRHWEIFTELCRKADAKGNLVPDAYLAAIAIEHGCEWITTDRGFSRYPGLRWRHPLD